MASPRRGKESIFAGIPSIEEVQGEMDSALTQVRRENGMDAKTADPLIHRRERTAAKRRAKGMLPEAIEITGCKMRKKRRCYSFRCSREASRTRFTNSALTR